MSDPQDSDGDGILTASEILAGLDDEGRPRRESRDAPPLPESSGVCVHVPADGRIVSGFGRRRSIEHPDTIRQHQGVDIAGRAGAPVYAVADGVVTHATGNGAEGFARYGRVIALRHSQLGKWTLYAHLSAADVRPGQVVRAGDRIGSIGETNGTLEQPNTTFRMTGGTSRPHLHFEVASRHYPMRYEESRHDPEAWLSFWGVTYDRGGLPSVRSNCNIAPPRPRTALGHFGPALGILGAVAVAMAFRR